MVSTTLHAEGNEALIAGLRAEDAARVLDAQQFARATYEDRQVPTGQDALSFSRGVVSALAALRTDADTRIAGMLFELTAIDEKSAEQIESHFGAEVANMVTGIRQLMRLHEGVIIHKEVGKSKNSATTQLETLRKMTLAMATDMRGVLVRLASRLTTLRYFAECKLENDMTLRYARETFDLYAPLANRLGVWQLKWELEDLSFRFNDPAGYKKIARMLEERRIERESFVEEAILRLKTELGMAEIKADVYGRP